MLSIFLASSISVNKAKLNVTYYQHLIDTVPDKYKRYWEWFFAFSQIPRQSHNHKYAPPAVVKWLKELGIPESSITIDEGPNVLARIPASPGYESSPTVCIQAHMDVAMHNKAEDVPYRVNLVNDWFVANETLLGADDGVGIAWMFLTCEERDEFKHGPIELLFTADEEVGLLGMNYLPGPENATHGLKAKSIINIDFFDSDKMAVASAGSIRFRITGKRDVSAVKDGYTRIDFSIKDMIGGHSGMNMINGRPTPQDWIARCLETVIENKTEIRIGNYESGDAGNVLPVNGQISLAVKSEDATKVKNMITEHYNLLKEQYTFLNLNKSTFEIKDTPITEDFLTLSAEDSIKFVDSIFSMFHGIIYYVDKAIYTSQNVAKIVFKVENGEGSTMFNVMPRTHIKGHLLYMRQKMQSFMRTFNFTEIVEESSSDPWFGNQEANIFKTFRESYKMIVGSEIEPVVFHAGIEAGRFAVRGYTDADVINFGADTVNAHTIGESVKVSTTNTKTDVLRLFLQKFADKNFKPPSSDAGKEKKSFKMTPALAGVIGALSTLIVTSIIFISIICVMKKRSERSGLSTPLL